ncbi:hypothetical protein VTN77DRAFT_9919 [Rasamsonia byssochlamydoides]|uniref:uncharacterized protein n=1 Tax=Rasamsonia byssochlamydoides TaxID=89139 RepID=UPI003744639D
MPATSPPLGSPAISVAEDFWPRDKWSRNAGEAAQTITEECERLFCDTLSALFLGERNRGQWRSLVVGAYHQNFRPDSVKNYRQIESWVELWDYANDAIYRGFVIDDSNGKTMFVFFEDRTSDHGIKTGLLSLFELADMDAFNCTRIVACVPRSADPFELRLVRSLGWCGFSLTTLEPWMPPGSSEAAISSRWLFLVADV